MSRQILEEYCRLICTDKDKCMELFSSDAELLTHGGAKSLCLKGKEELLDYFVYIPPDLKFSILDYAESEGAAIAKVKIEGINLPQVKKTWRCFFKGNLISKFEVLNE